MFGKKRKIELNNEELRIMMYSLTDFRNALLKENKYTDAVDDIISKLKNKIKADKYDLGIIINGLDTSRKKLISENKNTSEIDDLLLRLIEIHKTL